MVQCRSGSHVLVKNLALLLTGRLQPAEAQDMMTTTAAETAAAAAGVARPAAAETPAARAVTPGASGGGAVACNVSPFGGLPVAEASSPGVSGGGGGVARVDVVTAGLTGPYELPAGRYYCMEGCVVLQVREAWGCGEEGELGAWPC